MGRRKAGRLAKLPPRGPVLKGGWWRRGVRRVGAVLSWDGWVKLGAIATALGVVAGLIFTALSVNSASRQYALAQRTDITNRYAKAIEQIGNASVDVRLGGIYALERIAGDSGADSSTVYSVLTAFIRTHSPVGPNCSDTKGSKPSADVQAALTVIGRRQAGGDWLDLSETCLVGAVLDGEFENLSLTGANLSWAVPGSHSDPTFTNIALAHAHLDHAVFKGAKFTYVTAWGVTVRETVFDHVSFSRSSLAGVDLAGTNLWDVSFDIVDFHGVKFYDGRGEAPLTFVLGLRMSNVVYDESTQWAGWEHPESSGKWKCLKDWTCFR
ncbi:pentapeptide repeat-containing protein [Nocardia nova]|uniref:pentapeptide repeat-containing protein n=1 Tax=Nocardia nova TaxID=37330 RepID=UPI00046D5FE8|nr:pentapeptide repeat-containing protein [Nocardia nova]